MTKFKTKNVILATIACLLVLMTSIFALSACEETEKPDPDAMVKNDFTWTETEEVWNKMLEEINNADRISFNTQYVSQEDENQIKFVITNTTYYMKDVTTKPTNKTTETWIVFDGENNLTTYTAETNDADITYTKKSSTGEFKKVDYLFGGYFDYTEFSMDYLSKIERDKDGIYTITLIKTISDSDYYYELTLNANYRLTKLATGILDADTKTEIEYKYNLEADLIPAREYHQEWE